MKTKMSKFEKIFWITIIIFMTIFLIFGVLSIVKNPAPITEMAKEPITEEFITKYFPTDKIKDNLTNQELKINQNLNRELDIVNSDIDKKVDTLFLGVEKNVDIFLDFHYSIIGEYTELGAMATGKIEEHIKKQLFGDDFIKNIEDISISIDSGYQDSVKRHLEVVDNIATDGVDKDVNSKALNRLNEDISSNIVVQETKVGILLASAMGLKIVQLISAKLAAKAAAKMAAKSAVKLGTKSAAAGTAAAAGAICGPFAIICSPVAATVAWFTTDAIIVTGDEYFNREEFKIEILASLKESEESMKNDYKEAYSKSFHNFSDQIKDKYSQIEVVEAKRVMVKDRF